MTDEGHERVSYATRQRVWGVASGPAVRHLTVALGLVAVLAPIGWLVLTSLKTGQGVFEPRYLPRDPSLRAYRRVLVEAEFWKAVVNSLVISSVTTVLVVALAVPAGYAFSRFRFPFDDAVFVGVIFSRLFPPIGIIVPYYQGIAALGLLDSRAGIVIAHVYLWLPLMVYIMRNFFLTVPAEVDEAALVDGCTRLQAFRYVVLPLARPGVAAVCILTFLYSWREFLFAFMISETLSAKPIAVAVYSFVGEVTVNWEELAAAAVVAIVPTVLVVVFFQRYVVSGLTAGALKGR